MRSPVGIAAALVAIALSAAGRAADCRPDFVVPASYATPIFPVGIVASDVDGDGFPDLVYGTGEANQAFAVRLGKADGTFGLTIPRTTNVGATSFAVGAFDSGSTPDIVVSTFYGLQFFEGNGDGTFQDPVSIDASTLLRFLTAADFNGDGKLDLLGLSNGAPDTLYVYLGNGDGTFQAPASMAMPEYFDDVAVGHLDGNATPDLVAVSGNTKAYVLLGNGDGTFSVPFPYEAGESLLTVLLADANEDGKLDMILPSGISNLNVLLGNGDGTFQTPIASPTPPFPGRAVSADFDGDGHVDVALPGSGPGMLTILEGRGDGSFRTGASYAIDASAWSLVAAEFGTHTTPDIALGSAATGRISVLAGNGDGTFRGVRMSLSSDSYPTLIAQADFNEDGRPDAAVTYFNHFEVFLGAEGGAFTSAGLVPVVDDQIIGIAAADLDGNGHADVAVTLRQTAAVSVFLSHGDGTFTAAPALPLPAAQFYGAIAAADFDGDGRIDLAVGDGQSDGTGDLIVLLGQPGGTFAPPRTSPLPAYTGRLVAADFDGNGRSDLAALGASYAAGVSVLLSRGDGSFEPPVTYAVGQQGVALAVGDLRHSGHLDIVVANFTDQTLTVWNGQENGTFADSHTIGLGAQGWALAIADLDGDGNLDIATVDYNNRSSVLYGLGTGAFQSPVTYSVAAELNDVVAGDYDGNGLTDLLFVSRSYPGGLALLANGGLGATAADSSAVVGEAATLSVSAAGLGPLTYQWRKGGVPLSDGGTISGSTTATLTIDPVSFADAGSYDVVVTDSCGSVTSNGASLSVEFADVPLASPFHDDIISIATDGITSGCGGGNYCPTSPVRRDQMAVFLLKSEHGSAYTPPACTGVFADVPCPGPFADWIEQLAAEGVTGGCGGGNYCPSQSVTRAQMAIFLLKTSQGSSYAPPPAVGIFGDVPIGSFGADFVEDLYNKGITGGCQLSPLLYCPGNAVLRQQMATFLVRTFSP